MRERPILFSSPMVRAILEGRKTQTRRTVKPQPAFDPHREQWSWENKAGHIAWSGTRPQAAALLGAREICPYGQPGDRLWVRETWRVGAWRDDGRMAFDFAASPELVRTPWCSPAEDVFRQLVEQSDDDCSKAGTAMDAEGHWKWEHGRSPCRWRPSIYMPRWASRLTLEVLSVRVERLQAISEEDAKAEGVEPAPFCKASRPAGLEHVEAFEDLWDSINADRAPWASNPWVWCVEFRPLAAEAVAEASP